MTTTWTIAIDWDRDGQFTQTYDDVTDRVISAEWFLGTREAYADTADNSTLTLVLNNHDRRFSPEYASSPIAGKVKPFRRVQIESDDGSDTRTHWTGWIESLDPEVNQYGQRIIHITAKGVMQFYKAAETRLALQENQRVDEVIAELIKEVVIPPAITNAWILGRENNSKLGLSTWLADTSHYSNLDTAKTTLAIAADNWVQQGGRADAKQDTFNVYRAILDVVAAERGRFYFGRDGRALFWNRHKLVDEITNSATFDDTMQGLDYTYANVKDFNNEVVVVCHPRTISATANEVLWQLADEIEVPSGESRTLYAKYQDESGNRIGGKNVATDDITFSQGSASISIDPRANSAEITITNTGTKSAILMGLTIKGLKITDFGQLEAIASDGASIIDYGRRTLKINLPAIDNFDDAQNIAYFELHRRSEPRGTIRNMTLKSHGTQGGGHHAQQLARTLGDRVTIQETQSDHDGSYYLTLRSQTNRL
jgi:hypothetical protein